MSYPINYPTPQGANVQMLYRTQDWVKPQGASFVWFTLIGGGGNGNGSTTGGGSGAVTNCMVPAFLIPDVLRVNVSTGDSVNTTVVYQQKDGTGYTLLTANAASTTTGGIASTSNYFSCMGFFQSIAGQSGSTVDQTASATTFLSGGNGSGGVGTITANYGYSRGPGSGFFQMQPIIVGVGGANGSGSKGGIGCGSDATAVPPGATGGPGLAVIITW